MTRPSGAGAAWRRRFTGIFQVLAVRLTPDIPADKDEVGGAEEMSCTITGEMYLKYWQQLLGLGDWRIKLSDLADLDAVGETEWQEVNKTAHIRILDPRAYGERIVPFDYEKTLVHELLHLKTCLLTDVDDPLQARVGHILIDDLARSLVAAKRSEVGQYDER